MRFAAGLLALGLEPGDRVGIWSPNNAEWVVTQFATAKAGLILVNINPAYRTHELELRAEQGRLPCPGHRHQLQDQRLSGACCASSPPSWSGTAAAGCTARACPGWRP